MELNEVIKKPVLMPRREIEWELNGLYENTAYYDGETIHLLYTAKGKDGRKRIGYAKSYDGIKFERKEKPLIEEEVENPILSEVEGELYLSYIKEGRKLIIKKLDKESFIEKEKLKFYDFLQSSELERCGKIYCTSSVSLLSQKIDEEYVFLYSKIPTREYQGSSISINFNKEKYNPDNGYDIITATQEWEEKGVLTSTPALRIKNGWILIYYGKEGKKEGVEHAIGAALLEESYPEEVIGKTKEPIVKPSTSKGKRIVPGGCVAKESNILLYYHNEKGEIHLAKGEILELVRCIVSTGN